jgi:hypothetical protein
MASPIAHLPLRVNLTTSLNGTETTLATVEVPVPIKVSGPVGGYVEIALDTEELHALVRRAANALDNDTRKES